MVKRAMLAGTCLISILAGCSGGGGDDSAGAPNAGEPAPAAPGASDPGNGGGGQQPGVAAPSGSPFGVSAADDSPEGGPDTGPPGTAPDSGPDSGPADARPTGDGDPADIAALVGLWDYSRERADGLDRILFSIGSGGTITEYDDQADALGSGAACHVIRQSLLAARGNDRYDIQDTSTLPGSDSVDDVLITVDADTIVFRYIGSAFDPEFGDGMSGITESYPRAAGITAEQLTACEGN